MHFFAHGCLPGLRHFGQLAKFERRQLDGIGSEKVFGFDVERFGQLKNAGRVGLRGAFLELVQRLFGDVAQVVGQSLKAQASEHACPVDSMMNHGGSLVDEFRIISFFVN